MDESIYFDIKDILAIKESNNKGKPPLKRKLYNFSKNRLFTIVGYKQPQRCQYH